MKQCKGCGRDMPADFPIDFCSPGCMMRVNMDATLAKVSPGLTIKKLAEMERGDVQE